MEGWGVDICLKFKFGGLSLKHCFANINPLNKEFEVGRTLIGKLISALSSPLPSLYLHDDMHCLEPLRLTRLPALRDQKCQFLTFFPICLRTQFGSLVGTTADLLSDDETDSLSPVFTAVRLEAS